MRLKGDGRREVGRSERQVAAVPLSAAQALPEVFAASQVAGTPPVGPSAKPCTGGNSGRLAPARLAPCAAWQLPG